MSETLDRVTRRDLLDAVVKMSGMKRADALKCMDATFALIAEAMNQGRTVTIKGFGSFEMREVAARRRTDPRTGAVVDVPAGRKPRLRMAATTQP